MPSTSPKGTCKLTGESGVYVKSHLIPVALTRLSRSGTKYVETGIGFSLKHRSSSWYDMNLVTRAGEDILADIDDKGIRALRAHKLVWSSWGEEARLVTSDFRFHDERLSHRAIHIDDAPSLRLFFISLAWRAAASTLKEFGDVTLSDQDVEHLRQRVLAREAGNLADYPIHLFQIVSRGPEHNRTPILEEKEVLTPDFTWGPRVKYIRFYFDGLVSHVYLAPGQSCFSPMYLGSTLGGAEETIVFAHEFEYSRTADNLREMVIAVEHERRTPPVPLTALAAAAKAAANVRPV